MAASDSELQGEAEDALNANLGGGAVKRYKVGSREVERESLDKQLDVLLKLRGLQSSKRGVSVGKIDRPG